MPDVYRSEVTWDGVTHEGPDPTATNSQGEARLVFAATDAVTVNHSLAIEVKRARHSFGGGPTYEWRTEIRVGYGVDATSLTPPSVATTLATFLEADGENGQAFLEGGTLVIIKDEVTQTVTYETPMGNHTATFLAAGLSGNGALRGHSLSLAWGRPLLPDADGRVDLNWHSFWTEKNGVRTSGAQLGLDQIGEWLPTDTGYYFTGALPLIPTSNTITTTRRNTGFVYTHAIDAPRGGTIQEWNLWDGGDTIGDLPLVLDLTHDPATGTAWYTRIVKQHPEQVQVAWTEDYGLTWLEAAAGEIDGSSSRTPSITFRTDRKLWLTWHDGENGRSLRSDNLGRTFPGVPGLYLPSLFTGGGISAILQFMDPEDGMEYVLYTSGNTLRIQRVDATGVLFDPTTLATGLGTDQYPAAMFNSAREIIIEFSDGGTRWLMRSDDLGKEFLTEFTGPSALLGQRHIQHSSGLTFHLHAEVSGANRDLYVAPSADSGVTFHSARVLVVAGVPPQLADIEEMTDGSLLVAYQVYDAGNDEYDVLTKRSDDLGRTWN